MVIPTTLPEFEYTGRYETELRADWGWIIRLKSSGRLTFKGRSRKVDVFLVGGGGGGGQATYGSDNGTGGGGGGYTLTRMGMDVTGDSAYTVIIGEGGSGYHQSEGRSASGGTTSAFGLEAAGGQGGLKEYYGALSGGAGGSGGGGGANEQLIGGAGGFNGSAGAASNGVGGAGQGSTTYEFGMYGWKLYAGGGGGGGGGVSGVYGGYGPGGAGGAGGGGKGGDAFYFEGSSENMLGQDGEENSGGGGGGAGAQHGYNSNGAGGEMPGGSGASGIVCIRNNADDVLPVVFNGTWLSRLVYNGTDVKSLIYDGVRLYMRDLARRMRERRKHAGNEKTGAVPVCGPG